MFHCGAHPEPLLSESSSGAVCGWQWWSLSPNTAERERTTLRPVSEAVPCLNSNIDRERSVRPRTLFDLDDDLGRYPPRWRWTAHHSPGRSGISGARWRHGDSRVERGKCGWHRAIDHRLVADLYFAASPESATRRPPSNTRCGGTEQPLMAPCSGSPLDRLNFHRRLLRNLMGWTIRKPGTARKCSTSHPMTEYDGCCSRTMRQQRHPGTDFSKGSVDTR